MRGTVGDGRTAVKCASAEARTDGEVVKWGDRDDRGRRVPAGCTVNLSEQSWDGEANCRGSGGRAREHVGDASARAGRERSTTQHSKTCSAAAYSSVLVPHQVSSCTV